MMRVFFLTSGGTSVRVGSLLGPGGLRSPLALALALGRIGTRRSLLSHETKRNERTDESMQ